MEAAKPEVLSLVEVWLRESCPETLDMKGIHIFTRLCELSVFTYKDTGRLQCHPGRKYLGALVNWSTTKVSRLATKLKKYGVLKRYQPRTFDAEKQVWVPSTNVYSIPLLTPLRVKQLAVALKIKLGARMYLFPSNKRKEEKKSCVQSSVRKPHIPAGHVAHQVYRRILNMGKSVATEVEIKTGNVALNTLLNRFANLGKGHTP